MGTQGKAYLDALGCLAHLFAFVLFCLVELPEHVPAKLQVAALGFCRGDNRCCVLAVLFLFSHMLCAREWRITRRATPGTYRHDIMHTVWFEPPWFVLTVARPRNPHRADCKVWPPLPPRGTRTCDTLWPRRRRPLRFGVRHAW